MIFVVALAGPEAFLSYASALQLIALALAGAQYRQIGAWRRGRRSAPGSMFAVGLAIGLLPMWVFIIGCLTGCFG